MHASRPDGTTVWKVPEPGRRRGKAFLRLPVLLYAWLGHARDGEDQPTGEEPYPLAAIGALVGVWCQAESQPVRGRFASERLLRTLLEGPDRNPTGRAAARLLPYLIERGALIRKSGGVLYVNGWDEMQEGEANDSTVRTRKYRERIRQAEFTRRAEHEIAADARRRNVAVTSLVTVEKEKDSDSDATAVAEPSSAPLGAPRRRGLTPISLADDPILRRDAEERATRRVAPADEPEAVTFCEPQAEAPVRRDERPAQPEAKHAR